MLAPYDSKQKQVSGKAQSYNFKNRYLSEEELAKPDINKQRQILNQTANEFSDSVNSKNAASLRKYDNQSKKVDAQYIRYTPNNAGAFTNSTAKQRIVKMHQVQEDPLNPGGFKHKKVAKGPGSPPTTVMHSPPRKVTAQDMLDWKIPPCVSNWKNAKGYTIPLEMRLRADGRTLQQQTVSENHSKLANALYIAERVSRKELQERINIQKTLAHKEHVTKEQEMREEAKKAREEKNRLLEEQDIDQDLTGLKKRNPAVQEQEDLEKQQRDQIRYINKRETEREARLAAAGQKKAKQVRDQERDISEKVALGQAQANTGKREVQYDHRLFNQTGGLDSGFGDDDENRLYDKPLFQDRTAASIYKNIQEEEDDGRTSKGLDRILAAKKRGLDGGADGDSKTGSRTRPVEFEKHQDPSFAAKQFGDNVEKKVKRY